MPTAVLNDHALGRARRDVSERTLAGVDQMPSRYLLVCRGPNCRAQGSAEVRETLRRQLTAVGGADVLVLPYNCFGLCGRGPNAVLYPDGDWFEALACRDVPDLIEHLRGGSRATHLLARVDASYAEECYQIFEEVIPDLAAERRPESESNPSGWRRFFQLFRR